MVTNTRERRLWWRHLISFLFFPVTMTIVIPALIVLPAGVRGPQVGACGGSGTTWLDLLQEAGLRL